MKNKITLYRNSINNFINKNIEKYNFTNKKNELLSNDHILSIVSLTLISSLNRKNKRTAHGYNIAFAISVLSIYTGEIDLLCKVIKFFDDNLLLLASQITTDKIVNINCLSHDTLFRLINDIKEGKERLIALSKLAILIGWIMGCGQLNKEIMVDLEIAGEYLGNLIYISNNFDKNKYNEEFDYFVQSKQKFIEIMITYDIFSETMKSIINMYEDNIDNKVS